MKVSITIVPINYRLAPNELSYILEDSESELIIVGDQELLDAVNRSAAIKSIKHRYHIAGNSLNKDSNNISWQSFVDLYTDDSTPTPAGICAQRTTILCKCIPAAPLATQKVFCLDIASY